MVNLQIQSDLTCIRCGYNLRGLTFEITCPACGISGHYNAIALPNSYPEKDQILSALDRKPFERVAEGTAYPADALLFVRDLSNFLQGRVETPQEVRQLAGAQRICAEFRDFAIQSFPDKVEAIATLEAWNLRGSDDLKRVLIILDHAHLIRLSEKLEQANFSGLFATSTLFDGYEASFSDDFRDDLPSPPPIYVLRR